MACSELNPERDQNAKVDKALENTNDTAANPANPLTRASTLRRNINVLSRRNLALIHGNLYLLTSSIPQVSSPYHHRQTPISKSIDHSPCNKSLDIIRRRGNGTANRENRRAQQDRLPSAQPVCKESARQERARKGPRQDGRRDSSLAKVARMFKVV